MFHTAIIVLLTLLVNGTTTGHLVKYLNLQQTTLIQKKLLCDFVKNMNKNTDRML